LALWACKYSLKGFCREEPSTGTALPHSQQIEGKRRGGREGGRVGGMEARRETEGREEGNTEHVTSLLLTTKSRAATKGDMLSCLPAPFLSPCFPLPHRERERLCIHTAHPHRQEFRTDQQKKETVKKYRMY
jgi:hypothetical protein